MKARLVSFTDLAPGIRHFVFELPERVEFKAGQFASLVAHVNGKEITRAYSLAAGPRGDNRFEICLNRVEGGLFSPHLFDLPIGGEVDCKGILGTFGWREPVTAPLLVATGTGIVPFRAMLQNAPVKPVLIYGARYEESLLWREELAAQSELILTLTRPGGSWRGRSGRVQPIVEEQLAAGSIGQVYICGLKEMVDSVRALCKEKGLDRRQIIYEKYD
jgi:CDP-4-dehydro-6-deoxyglucose reductase